MDILDEYDQTCIICGEILDIKKSPLKKTINGAGDGIRTHDFNLGKVALYP